MGYPRRAAEKTFFIHEGPRRTTKKTFARSQFGLSTKGRGENLFIHEGPRRKPLQGHYLGCPRRAAEKTFLSTKGHEGPRRTPLQDHNLGCPRGAAEKTSFDPRRATKDHEENLLSSTKGHEERLCKVIIWAVHTGPRRKSLVVDSDDGRRTGESGEKRSDSARRPPVFVTL